MTFTHLLIRGLARAAPGARPPGPARPHFPVQSDSGGHGVHHPAWGSHFPRLSSQLRPSTLSSVSSWTPQLACSENGLSFSCPTPLSSPLLFSDFESLDSDRERKSSEPAPTMMGCIYFPMESIETPVQWYLCYGLLVSKNITRFCHSAPLPLNSSLCYPL